jgi:hypothetical protein
VPLVVGGGGAASVKSVDMAGSASALLSVFVEEVRAMMTKITVRSSEVDIYSNKQHVLAVFTTEANTSFHFSKQLGILSRNYLALSAPHPWLSTLPTIFMHSWTIFTWWCKRKLSSYDAKQGRILHVKERSRGTQGTM